MTEQNQEIKPFLRVLNTDLEGNRPIWQALRKINGVSYSMANAICNLLELPKMKKAGLLNDEEVKKIESLVKEAKLPKWMMNRRKDYITGDDAHLVGSDLKFARESDLKKLKRMRSYRGIRHAIGQPSRGQRTRSHFRHGRAVGVQKTKAAKAAVTAAAAKPEKGGKAK